MAFENYRKAKKGEITCEQCKHSILRWWSRRWECERLAVGKHHTCDSAEDGPKINYAAIYDN